MIWVLIMVVMVIGVKFYTATRMRDLERRLNEVKESLHEKKDEFNAAQTQQTEVQTEENGQTERIRLMKELIDDIQIRLTVSDQPDTELAVDSAGPPPRSIM